MTKHAKHVAVGVALLGAAGASALPAAGADRVRKPLDLGYHARHVSGDDFAGSGRDKRFGAAAVTYRRNAGGVRGRHAIRIWLAAGTLLAEAQVASVPAGDGNNDVTGKGRIVGGTGRYRGARGTIRTISGRFIGASSEVFYRYRGTVTLPR